MIKRDDMNLDNNETKTVKQFAIILIILIILVGVIYIFTTKVVNKDSNNDNSNNSSSTTYIDPTKAIVGTMLNKGTDEYYVLIYDSTIEEASSYARLLTQYKSGKDIKETYTVDLNNPINSKYIASDDKTNPTATNLDDLRFGKITLLKVKDNKIVSAYESVEAIKKELKILDAN